VTEETKHTGWEYHRGDDYAVVMLPDDNTDTATIQIWGDDDEDTDRLGNLIAAAPDLLEALKLARDLFVNSESACAEICDAAIAKAEGSPQ